MKKYVIILSVISVLFAVGFYFLQNKGLLFDAEEIEENHQQRAQQNQIPFNTLNRNTNNTILSNSKANKNGKDTLYVASLSFLNVGKKFSSDNIEIFQILGNQQIGKKYISLGEAMEKNYVTIYETESVNNLAVQNHSDFYVFIHSGDIVKGGKQDRTIQYDLVIEPNSKKIDLASFCVEKGRWEKRGGESLANFSVNTDMISSKKLKIATKYSSNQSEVWSEVSEQQTKINANIRNYHSGSVDVTANESESSLQLTLENKELLEINKEQLKAFDDFDEANVLGFAYFINGKFYGIEVYNSKQLFTDIWSKQLKALLIEALSDKNDTYKEIKTHTKEQVAEYLNFTEQNQKIEKVNNIIALLTGETTEENNTVIFSTFDRTENSWIHRSYLSLE